ncbi:MAG TPA: hypothetical protein VMV03_10650 [Spirochaetia bacterium]|nr:hypothetical protein [Spirochaetia bacterium]
MRYTLEVVSPVLNVPLSLDEELLTDALDAIATIHGGMVVESAAEPGKGQLRQYVNIYDCESSLKDEVEWLKKKFPDVRFALKEFT